ncbi:MAG: hypothetical protein ABIJ18_05650 [archaeon]
MVLNSLKKGLQALVLASSIVPAGAMALEDKFAVSVYGEQDADDTRSKWIYGEELAENGYEVIDIDFRSDDDFSYEGAILQQLGKIHRQKGDIPVLLFNMHGTPYSMRINSGWECEGIGGFEKEDCFIDIWDTKFFQKIKEYMADDGVIILNSCSTGKGDVNLAKVISMETGLSVYAPVEDTSMRTRVRAALMKEAEANLDYVSVDEEGYVDDVYFYTLTENHNKPVFVISGFRVPNDVVDITKFFHDEEKNERFNVERALLTDVYRVDRGPLYLIDTSIEFLE